jgi:ribosomal protein S18 acetylase RimI-like enzyme
VPAVVRGLAGVAAEERFILTESPVDEEQLTARFTALVESETDTLLVAEADGVVIGDLGIQGGTTSHPAAFGMSVAPEWRGRGVGSALLVAAIEWTRAAGIHKLWLEVFAHNEGGLALYRKHGFVEEGRLRSHYRRRNGELWDAIVMGLVLVPPPPGSDPRSVGV